MSNNNKQNFFVGFLSILLLLFSTGVIATPAGDNIIITEVEYDPVNISPFSENTAEWFELFNPTASPIDIGGWTMKEGNPTPTYTFPSPTIIAPGDYLLVTNRTDRFKLNYPDIEPDLEMAQFSNSGLLRLNNSGGDQLTLRDTTNAIVDYVAWEFDPVDDPANWTTVGAVNGPICRVFNVDTDLPADWGDCSTSPTPGSGPGFTLSKTSSNITEGDTDTFTVVLTAQPFSDVVIDLTSSNLGAATLSATSLTFSSLNWDDPQTVTITAVEDDADLFDESLNIVASINDASSDNSFDSLIDQSLAVTVEDNDLAQLSIDDVALVESDSGDTDYTFTISIDLPSPDEITVDYATADSTATLTDSDYIGASWAQKRCV